MSSSEYLFSALNGRAYFGSFTIILPKQWAQKGCAGERTVSVAEGEKSDIKVTESHPIYGNTLWTQQSRGCGEQGDQIYMSHGSMDNEFPRNFVREWAKYRYGIFDEIGFRNDSIYPLCYVDNGVEYKSSGCLGASQQLCDAPTDSTQNNFSSSIPGAEEFCEEHSHNRYAPTKQNQMCNRKSSLAVILSHSDFNSANQLQPNSGTTVDTKPQFHFKTRQTTRFVVAIEENADMSIRDSWTFLRVAIRKWVLHDLPKATTEIGIVLTGTNNTLKWETIAPLLEQETTDRIASAVPYLVSGSGCIPCAINKSLELLKVRAAESGPASNVIVLIAPGMDYKTNSVEISKEAVELNTRIVTINYPGVMRRKPLDELALLSDGTSYTVFERKYNVEKSYLTTYFELSNIFMEIGALYYEGNSLDLPVEIHRKELNTSTRNSFTLDQFMGVPSYFFVYTYTNNEIVLIRHMELTSPNGEKLKARSDARLNVKQLMIRGNIAEPGSWSYKIEKENGNPQPDYVQVMATALSTDSPIVQARFWVKRVDHGLFVFYVEVRRGLLPVESAMVEMSVSRLDECNRTLENCAENMKISLLDTGSDPDTMKGDGIYSRYFSGNPGIYRFEVVVTDHGQTAYSLSDRTDVGYRCCGSAAPISAKQALPPFQRYLTPITLFISESQIEEKRTIALGRIGDLRAKPRHNSTKVDLYWTTPDTANEKITRYKLKFASRVQDVVDNFDTVADEWIHDTNSLLPIYSVGDESFFTVNLGEEPNMIGQVYYFALQAILGDEKSSFVSNYVSVYVPKVHSSVRPSYNPNEFDSHNGFEYDNDSIQDNDVIAGIGQHFDNYLRWEILVYIVIGCIVLFAVLIVYCLFCLARRRRKSVATKDMKGMIKKEAPINVIVPAETGNEYHSPQHQLASIMTSTPNGVTNSNYLLDTVDHQTIGLPIYNTPDEDFQKAAAHYPDHHEKQLIEELKQQQQFQHHQIINDMMLIDSSPTGCNLSIISSSNNTLTRNGRILSPYESWTASQLLHEHERRHSPLEGDMHLYGSQTEQLPPVPPLPYQAQNQNYGYRVPPNDMQLPPQYSTIHRTSNQALGPNPTPTANCIDKKRRNVTMV